MKDIKQYIIVRKDLKMKPGKLAAQVSHASMASFLDVPIFSEGYLKVKMTPEKHEWIDGIFTKVVLGIDTKKELIEIYDQIRKLHIPHKLIIDSGLTVFSGEKTITCLGVGPVNTETVKNYLGHLRLL